ncbi:MAG: ChaB family protein [Pyrinomonadaceae bacterium]
MTYKKLSHLPLPVRKEFPRGAQEIYRAAYNRTWEQAATSGDYDEQRTAEAAHKAALLAVEMEYQRDDRGRWRRAPISNAIDKRKIRPQG